MGICFIRVHSWNSWQNNSWQKIVATNNMQVIEYPKKVEWRAVDSTAGVGAAFPGEESKKAIVEGEGRWR